jgi:hypothetical protein
LTRGKSAPGLHQVNQNKKIVKHKKAVTMLMVGYWAVIIEFSKFPLCHCQVTVSITCAFMRAGIGKSLYTVMASIT